MAETALSAKKLLGRDQYIPECLQGLSLRTMPEMSSHYMHGNTYHLALQG
jgi:hypothetical protein